MKNLFILSLYNVVLIAFVHSGYIYDDLSKFCVNNGLVFLSLTTTDEQPMLHNEAIDTFIALEKHGLRVRKLNYADLYYDLQFNLDTFVLLTDTKIILEPNTFQIYLAQIGKHRIRKSILVFTDKLSTSQEMELQDALQDLLTIDAWFTILYQKSDNMTE